MKLNINSLQEAALCLQSFVKQRQKAYESALQNQHIKPNHPAFEHCLSLLRCIKHVANGETQIWHIADVVKQRPGLFFIAKKKDGQPILTHMMIINTCIDYMVDHIAKKAA